MFKPSIQQEKIIELVKLQELSVIVNLEYQKSDYKEIETDHFLYWIRSVDYIQLDSSNLTILEKNIYEYTFEDIVKDNLSKEYKLEALYHSTRDQHILRFSKTYGHLEYYTSSSQFRFPRFTRKQTKKIICHRKIKRFNFRVNNVVLINGIRYISLKNFLKLGLIYTTNENIALELLNIHLGSSFKHEEFAKSNLSYYFHLPIANKISRGCKSLSEVLQKLSKNPIPKILLQKFSIKELIHLYLMVEEREICKIISFIKENVNYLEIPEQFKKIDINYNAYNSGFNGEERIGRILCLLMAYNLKLTTKVDLNEFKVSVFAMNKDIGIEKELTYIRDYLNMYFRTDKKINLSITSINRLKYLHDEAAIQERIKGIPNIKVSKLYPDFKILCNDLMISLGIEIKLITTSKELITESVEMNHCVAGYHSQINSGKSGIYSIISYATKERATLELCIKQRQPLLRNNKLEKSKAGNILLNPTPQFHINQCNGIWNSAVSKPLKGKINEVLNATIFSKPMEQNIEAPRRAEEEDIWNIDVNVGELPF